MHETAPSDKGQRGMVPRLNIGFETVQLEFVECVTQDELHPLHHQALPCVRHEGVVTEECVLESTTDQVAKVDDANQIARALGHN